MMTNYNNGGHMCFSINFSKDRILDGMRPSKLASKFYWSLLDCSTINSDLSKKA